MSEVMRRTESVWLVRVVNRRRTGSTCKRILSFPPAKRREHVIRSAAGAKDLLSRWLWQKQVLRYARVPRASLRMTAALPLKKKKRERRGPVRDYAPLL